MPGKTLLIIANGELKPETVAKIDLKTVDEIIAADGGALNAVNCGLQPDIIIGDLDSLPREFSPKTNARLIRISSQESNDLDKALNYCREQKAEKVSVVGFTGKRVDHTLNNFSVLARYARSFQLEMFDARSRMFFVRDEFSYAGTRGQVVSLIPLGEVTGIVTRGLRYPLQNEILAQGLREGASNECVDGPFQITVGSGVLLVFIND